MSVTTMIWPTTKTTTPEMTVRKTSTNRTCLAGRSVRGKTSEGYRLSLVSRRAGLRRLRRKPLLYDERSKLEAEIYAHPVREIQVAVVPSTRYRDALSRSAPASRSP